MKSVIRTGGSRNRGKAPIRELLNRSCQVMNVDAVAPAKQRCHSS